MLIKRYNGPEKKNSSVEAVQTIISRKKAGPKFSRRMLKMYSRCLEQNVQQKPSLKNYEMI